MFSLIQAMLEKVTGTLPGCFRSPASAIGPADPSGEDPNKRQQPPHSRGVHREKELVGQAENLRKAMQLLHTFIPADVWRIAAMQCSSCLVACQTVLHEMWLVTCPSHSARGTHVIACYGCTGLETTY